MPGTAVSADPEAAFLAGGTNLVDHLKPGVAEPGLPVDVTALTSTTPTNWPRKATSSLCSTRLVRGTSVTKGRRSLSEID